MIMGRHVIGGGGEDVELTSKVIGTTVDEDDNGDMTLRIGEEVEMAHGDVEDVIMGGDGMQVFGVKILLVDIRHEALNGKMQKEVTKVARVGASDNSIWKHANDLRHGTEKSQLMIEMEVEARQLETMSSIDLEGGIALSQKISKQGN